MKKFTAALVFAGVFAAWTPGLHAEDYPADNSGKNVRDRDSAAVTSGDQSNAKSDIRITQQIRKAVVSDKHLSTNAHNVKIITAGGMVTLRGPVKNAREKATIAAKAQRIAGANRVNDELEVVSQ